MNEIFENSIGFEDDEIFLLSAKEYEKYKKVIPHTTSWWWLRSPGNIQNSANVVLRDGSISYSYDYVNRVDDYIRPAIKTFKNVYNIGDRICSAGYTWVIIDQENGIAIAEMPIAQCRFDPSSNDYKTSEIRRWLLDWYKGRKEYFRENDSTSCNHDWHPTGEVTLTERQFYCAKCGKTEYFSYDEFTKWRKK